MLRIDYPVLQSHAADREQAFSPCDIESSRTSPSLATGDQSTRVSRQLAKQYLLASNFGQASTVSLFQVLFQTVHFNEIECARDAPVHPILRQRFSKISRPAQPAPEGKSKARLPTSTAKISRTLRSTANVRAASSAQPHPIVQSSPARSIPRAGRDNFPAHPRQISL